MNGQPKTKEGNNHMSIWDDADINSAGEFVKFEKIGDEVDGIITALGKHTWDDGKVSAKVGFRLDNDDEVTLTAGQYRLKVALSEARPEIGDRCRIVFTSVDKLAGGKTAKNFDVTVTRATDLNTPAPAAAAAAQAPF